jgi:membrane protein insertase Oxa1/YidC/SpoIIIJ
VNPATGCITGLLQAPFLFILYSVIRGLSNTETIAGKVVSVPKNIPRTSLMYHDLRHATPPGAMLVWHMNIALKAINSHGSFLAALPFYALIAIAVGVQYFQMSQLNRRNQNKSQMSSQMLLFQRITPILFAYIYFIVPAAAVIYMIFSSLIRILTQDLLFRYDKPKPQKPAERAIQPAVADATDDVKSDSNVTPQGTSPNGAVRAASGSGSSAKATAPTGAPTAGKAAAAPKPAPEHPRSRDKRKRKAR